MHSIKQIKTGTTASKTGFTARKYRFPDESGVSKLLAVHMKSDDHWPPAYARENWNLSEWMAFHSDLGRWVAHDERGVIVGHAGISSVPAGPEADLWMRELSCDITRLAEIARLIVSPQVRLSGVSGLMTRRCVRNAVEQGFVPVANAYASATSSLKMMTNCGWRIVGKVFNEDAQSELCMLIPPQKLVDAAFAVNRSRIT